MLVEGEQCALRADSVRSGQTGDPHRSRRAAWNLSFLRGARAADKPAAHAAVALVEHDPELLLAHGAGLGFVVPLEGQAAVRRWAGGRHRRRRRVSHCQSRTEKENGAHSAAPTVRHPRIGR